MSRRRRAPILGLVTASVYLFLYAPLVVLVAYSFNAGRLSADWQGVTLQWYRQALGNPAILGALRNSLLAAASTTVLSTAIATAACLGLQQHRFRHAGTMVGLLSLPLVVPEIVLAASLVLLFASLGLRLGMITVVLAHVSFSVSYAVLVVRARLLGLDPTLDEAAMELGADPLRTFLHVTLPGLAPGILAAGLLVFALSIDDYVVTSFVAGVGATTLPLQIYSMVRSGLSPEINAISTLLLVATSLLLLGAYLLEQGLPQAPTPSWGRRMAVSVVPAALGLALLAAPFALAPRGNADESRVLNLYIWSNYIAPETVRRFEERHHVHVNVDLYDTNEALLAKVQARNTGYDVLCPSNYAIEILAAQGLLLSLDHAGLPHFANIDPAFLDRPHDPGNRHSVPYFWGTAGIAYRKSRVGVVDSWASLWDERWKGRILMLDDAREAFGAALKRQGRSLNEKDPAALREAQRMLLLQKPLVRTYNSSNYEDVLLSGDVWLAQGWNGQFARAMDQDSDISYVIPREGSSLFLDSLVIPKDAPHKALAHAFLDFTMEAEVAAEICRSMRYSTPNRAAALLLPEDIRKNAAIFPDADVLARTELIQDLGETTVLYDRLWTEIKAGDARNP